MLISKKKKTVFFHTIIGILLQRKTQKLRNLKNYINGKCLKKYYFYKICNRFSAFNCT